METSKNEGKKKLCLTHSLVRNGPASSPHNRTRISPRTGVFPPRFVKLAYFLFSLLRSETHSSYLQSDEKIGLWEGLWGDITPKLVTY